jgi:circadian clock protein KaiB
MMAASRRSTEKFEKLLVDQKHKDYVLRLYVAGTTMRSARAIANVKEICEEYLRGSYRLEVIDLYQQPHLAHDEQIVAAPTLIKQLPLPVRRVLGDMSRTERVLVVLGLAPKQDAEPRGPDELH